MERQKGMLDLLQKQHDELEQTKTMIELVLAEKALDTPNVRSTITRLGQVGQDMERQLQKMEVRRGRVRDFILQIVSGQRKQDALEGILVSLERTKHDLAMYIQLA